MPSVLAVMALILGAGCLVSAAFPMAQDAPRGVLVGLDLVGVTIALTLVLAGAEVSPVYLHITVVLFTTLIGVMVAVAATERGLMMSALGYTWTAVYVAFFFRPGAARLYAALMITALGLSLLSARAPTDVSVWVTISTMVWVAVAILTRLNARLRAEAHTDSLTGLLNRTGFAVAAARQRAMAERRGEPLSLAVIDLDDFKLVTTAAATLPATACSSRSPGSGLHRCGRATCWHGSTAPMRVSTSRRSLAGTPSTGIGRRAPCRRGNPAAPDRTASRSSSRKNGRQPKGP